MSENQFFAHRLSKVQVSDNYQPRKDKQILSIIAFSANDK